MGEIVKAVLSPVMSILGMGSQEATAPAPAAAAPVAPITPVEAPKAAEPQVMPTPSDPNSKSVKRASIASQLRQRGRASTIMTDSLTNDSLGG